MAWKTIRVVIEVRSNDDKASEQSLARSIMYALKEYTYFGARPRILQYVRFRAAQNTKAPSHEIASAIRKCLTEANVLVSKLEGSSS